MMSSPGCKSEEWQGLNGQHGEIADYLNTCFRQEIQRLGREWVSKQMVIGIQSPRGDRQCFG
ncbi:MAG: hypothetical protein WBA57_14595 [Elainellaceae cyanobacterium]